jgi:hypothetical protein
MEQRHAKIERLVERVARRQEELLPLRSAAETETVASFTQLAANVRTLTEGSRVEESEARICLAALEKPMQQRDRESAARRCELSRQLQTLELAGQFNRSENLSEWNLMFS